MRDVVLITVDSLRQDHLSCYGYNKPTSPNIDSVAENSHLFRNCFAHAGATRVSFPTILSSSYTSIYGGHERITEDRTLVSEALKQAGYKNGGFHSNLYLSGEFGYSRDFDKFYDSRTDPSLTARLRQAVTNNLDEKGLLYKLLKWAYDLTEERAGVDIGSSYTSAKKITDMSINWVDNTKESESPRFLWTHYMDVHHPYIPPEEHQLKFREEPITKRDAIKLRRKMLESPEQVTEEELEDIIHLYDSEIRYTDYEIGRLLEAVEQSWDENPLVIITSDHGEEFLEHGTFSHSGLYDEILHVPLIIEDGKEGEKYNEIVGLIDISPTILDYVGVEQPENFHGYSIKSLINNKDWGREHVAGAVAVSPEILEEPQVRFVYRDEKWKYIYDDRNREWEYINASEELYNLNVDPVEKENLIDENEEAPVKIKNELQRQRDLIKRTSSGFETVEMNENVKERLRKLGYKE